MAQSLEFSASSYIILFFLFLFFFLLIKTHKTENVVSHRVARPCRSAVVSISTNVFLIVISVSFLSPSVIDKRVFYGRRSICCVPEIIVSIVDGGKIGTNYSIDLSRKPIFH